MVFEEDVGAALDTACGQDCDSDVVHLAHATTNCGAPNV